VVIRTYRSMIDKVSSLKDIDLNIECIFKYPSKMSLNKYILVPHIEISLVLHAAL